MRCNGREGSCTASAGRPTSKKHGKVLEKKQRRHGSGLTSVSQRRSAVEACGGAEFFFDAKELIVFGNAVGAAGGAGLDLPGGSGDGEIGDEGVLGFAGAVRNDGVVAGFAGQLDSVDGFRDAANLVQLDENGVGDAFVDAAGKTRGVGDEEVVAHKLDFLFG